MKKLFYILTLFTFYATAHAGNTHASPPFLFSHPLDGSEKFFRFSRSPIAEQPLESEALEESCQNIAESKETAADEKSIVGFWQTLNQSNGKPEGIVAIYEYEGNYYGRLIASYNPEGKIIDSIYHPVERAPGIRGNPYYCGLDFVWNLRPSGSKFKGKIIDPRKGKVYDAEVWRRGKDLILRGKVLMFGKNLTWPPVKSSVFSSSFKKPKVATFVPVRPRVN